MAENVLEYENFVRNHNTQLLTSGIPELYWKSLFKKLSDEIFDAHDYFTLVQDELSELHPVVSHEGGIKKDDPNSVFLIDHAWTYEAEYAHAQLKHVPGLAKRMAMLMNLLETGGMNDNCSPQKDEGSGNEVNKQCDEKYSTSAKVALSVGFYTDENGSEIPTDTLVELIFDNMWRFNQHYQVRIMEGQSDSRLESSSLKEQVSFWYIMDEFGSKIRHSDNPTWNIRCFFFTGRGISYSILFPTEDCSYGDVVTRDFVPWASDPVVRAAALYPWKPEFYVLKDKVDMGSDIDAILFRNEARCQEIYKEESAGVIYLSGKDTYNVFTDVAVVAESIKDPAFHLVDNPDEADILWITDHFKNFKSLQESGKQFINQFPFENVLTCKDLLARVVDRVGGLHPDDRDCPNTNRPPWFQESFNLNLELPQFVRNFLLRKERNEDNTWIIKPWNLGRSLDTHVTQNLNHIIRLSETGPKIAFKYIHNPVLLEREGIGKVKFHFRYMAALTSVDPLIIDVDEVFWIGCANKPFSLDHFDVYEKHFTTMNYRHGVTFQQLLHDEFIETFNQQYSGYKWSDTEKEVHKVIKHLFEAASSEPPPRGIGHCKISRAYYALDFMLKWADDDSTHMQPVLLEVNFNPDCNRLCKYYPDSFHHLFTSLFLGEKTPWGSVHL